MKDFIRAYNYTLVPIVGLLIALCTIYIHITQQIPLEKAIKLGTLYGFFIGIVLNILAAYMLLRKIQQPSIPKDTKEKSKFELKADNEEQEQEEIVSVIPNILQNNAVTNFLKEMYLLVDKDMAFDISLQAIMEHSLGKPSNTNKHRGTFSIRINNQTIDFEIMQLTRHTSKINIQTQHKSKVLLDIIRYIKEREFSILAY